MEDHHTEKIALPLSKIIACILIGGTTQLPDRGSHEISRRHPAIPQEVTVVSRHPDPQRFTCSHRSVCVTG